MLRAYEPTFLKYMTVNKLDFPNILLLFARRGVDNNSCLDLTSTCLFQIAIHDRNLLSLIRNLNLIDLPQYNLLPFALKDKKNHSCYLRF